ncbi:MAG: DUF4301 family protein [Bacteroidales bacterium]|nr:DUF4301 family protein [Bacteroidales bacterium]
MFSQKDLQQIQHKGIRIDDINHQIKYYRTGFPFADISMPATPGKGMIYLTDGDEKHYREVFRQNGPDFNITRFIPASGAATRMFKSLYGALEAFDGKSPSEQQSLIDDEPELGEFFQNLTDYPFYNDMKLDGDVSPADVLKLILGETGLNYGSKPKGLLKFHKYSESERRTSFEEHIREAVQYCASRDGKLHLHLTVSPAHLDDFQTEAARILPQIEAETGFLIDISFSFQKPETDTIAVDLDNEPFRNPDGSLLFRPGGHGALIRNLDALESDILFISNIDNVTPDRLKEVRVNYKQVLGGVLLEIRSKVFYFLQQLTGEGRVEKTRLDSMVTFLHERLGIAIPDRLESWDTADLKKWLISTMDRPIRVCGMVKNEGEPGGGPFYVHADTGEMSLQIVESSQIDLDDPEKAGLLQLSTHFNPVDLVCSIRDFRGKKFNLTRYVDHNTGFISQKSVGGKALKALELPGLWNGAMAHWLTLFLEVPVETFSPVKTVFDLMRPEHLT